MGGHYWTDPAGELQPVIVRSEFELVISLFTLVGHGPAPAIEHLVAEIPDSPLAACQIEAVQDLARATARAVAGGRTVLGSRPEIRWTTGSAGCGPDSGDEPAYVEGTESIEGQRL